METPFFWFWAFHSLFCSQALAKAVASAKELKTTCLQGGLPHYPGNSEEADGSNERGRATRTRGCVR